MFKTLLLTVIYKNNKKHIQILVISNLAKIVSRKCNKKYVSKHKIISEN